MSAQVQESSCHEVAESITFVQALSFSEGETIRLYTGAGIKMMEGLRPNLGGSVIAMRAWPQLSPCKVVLGLTAKDDSAN